MAQVNDKFRELPVLINRLGGSMRLPIRRRAIAEAHMSYVQGTHDVHLAEAPSILILQAGTAISDRTRGEPNAYNLLQVEKGQVDLDVRAHVQDGFHSLRRQRFRKDSKGHWQILPLQP